MPAELALVAPPRIGVCKHCAGVIEFVTTGPDPNWWRHQEALDVNDRPHAAVPR